MRKIARDAELGAAAMRDKTLEPNMPNDVREGDDARPALERIQPVGHPRMAPDIRLAAPPDIQAVAAVKRDGQPDEQKFDGHAPGNLLQAGGGGVVTRGADEGIAIGPEMLGEECANGNDAAEGMQFVPEITGVRLRRRAGHPLSEKFVNEAEISAQQTCAKIARPENVSV